MASVTPSSPSSSSSSSFLRLESFQCVGQSIPSVMASIPQTLPTPSTTKGIGSGLIQPNPITTLSPLTPLTHTSAEYIAHATEQRLRELISSGLAFMRHSNRRVLTTEDIALALRHKNAQPIWGYDSASNSGGAAANDALFTQAADDLFMLSDPLVSFEELLNQPLPTIPPDTTFSLHWLAIDGFQPRIPENPSMHGEESTTITSSAVGGGGTTATTLTLDKHTQEVVTKPPIKHVLSKEQTLYYDYVTSALRGNDSTLKKAVYKSLSQDDGLYQLLPYFTQFIASEVHSNLHNLQLLMAVMKMANCLLHSPYLHLDPYLHQLLPPILTCTVGKQLCLEPFEDHWQLRDYTSDMILFICQKYSDAYPTLQYRITKTLGVALLDNSKSFNTHYGCIVTLNKLGPLVVKKLILPLLSDYVNHLLPALNSSNEPTKMEASFVYYAIMDAVTNYLRHEFTRSANPLELTSSVHTMLQERALNGDDTNQPLVKLEASDESVTAPNGNKKKRRREMAQTVGSSPSGAMFPPSDSLTQIDFLLELFGESLQPVLTSMIRQIEDQYRPIDLSSSPVPVGPSIARKGGKMIVSRSNLNAANTFI